MRGTEVWYREFVIPSRVTRFRVDTQIPWMLMRSTLFRLAQENGHRVCVMGVFKCGGAHFQRDCNACKSTGKQSSGKGKQSKSWSKSEGKGKRTRRNPKENPKEPKVPKAHTRVKHRKLVSQVLKTRDQR